LCTGEGPFPRALELPPEGGAASRRQSRSRCEI
jgi:hypothetical protein